MDMERKPRPINAIAESGRPAISPHRVTGTEWRWPASTISFSARRKGGDRSSKRSATRALPRSTALKNWNRSLEPTETKSSELPSARRAGTGAPAPRSSRRSSAARGMTWPKRARCGHSRSIRSRARRSSDTSVTIGNMTRSSRPAAALSKRAQLGAHQARPVERQAQRPVAERRIVLGRTGADRAAPCRRRRRACGRSRAGRRRRPAPPNRAAPDRWPAAWWRRP